MDSLLRWYRTGITKSRSKRDGYVWVRVVCDYTVKAPTGVEKDEHVVVLEHECLDSDFGELMETVSDWISGNKDTEIEEAIRKNYYSRYKVEPPGTLMELTPAAA